MGTDKGALSVPFFYAYLETSTWEFAGLHKSLKPSNINASWYSCRPVRSDLLSFICIWSAPVVDGCRGQPVGCRQADLLSELFVKEKYSKYMLHYCFKCGTLYLF